MPTWEYLPFSERALITIQLFPTLEPDVVQTVLEMWSGGVYDESWEGEQRAIADLITMLRWASLSDEQKGQELDRIALYKQEKMK